MITAGMTRLSDFSYPLSQPLCECFLGHGPRTESGPDFKAFGLGCIYVEAVQAQESTSDHRGRPFIPVDEWMIASNAESVSRSEGGNIRAARCLDILRSMECRFQQTEIAQARRAAVLGYLFVMDGEHNGLGNPVSHRFASSRSMSRSLFITSRAVVI